MKTSELNDWSQKCFRRILVDMHIPDWDKRFLSKLDAGTYVKTVAEGKIISELQALFARHNAGAALSEKAVFKPTKEFHGPQSQQF
jgi:hypothetical protein